VIKFFKLALWAVFAAVGVGAETNGWQAPGHVQMAIWPKAAPNPQPVRGPEVVEPSGNTFLVAGKQVIGVSNVTRPTMTVYSPERKNSGVAVIVFPGGGYQTLAIDLEGTEAISHPRHQPFTDANLALNPDLQVTARTPPTFLLQAEDDHIDSVYDSLAYFIALQKAGVPTEMHLYAHGGHAFGLRPTKHPITEWPFLVERWLKTIGMVPE
jgi:acetyl esterase/lipase